MLNMLNNDKEFAQKKYIIYIMYKTCLDVIKVQSFTNDVNKINCIYYIYRIYFFESIHYFNHKFSDKIYLFFSA